MERFEKIFNKIIELKKDHDCTLEIIYSNKDFKNYLDKKIPNLKKEEWWGLESVETHTYNYPLGNAYFIYASSKDMPLLIVFKARLVDPAFYSSIKKCRFYT